MKRMKLLPILLLAVFLIGSCAEKQETVTAQSIVDQAIQSACNGKCDNIKIDFTFRDRCYVSSRINNRFQLERITSDSTGVTHDYLNNSGFTRFVNDSLVQVPDSMAIKYANSINSVHYFAQLPYGLNDAAVQKELLGDATIHGKNYFEVGVTFKEEGGGTDFQDKFVYWIQKEDFTVDYLAYSYETDGGGIRFREAYNERWIDGIRFVDYNNYKPESLDLELNSLDDLFQKGALQLLSKIETESVGVAKPELQ